MIVGTSNGTAPQTQTVVILGMHRSGTSCLTRALHQGGMFLGNRLLDHPNPDNVEGHWESVDAIEINDAILAASGARWDRVPADLKLVAPADTEERMDRLLKTLVDYPVAGFKDPRTVITYPLWQPRLGEHTILACLRHPLHVAKSLLKREMEGMTMDSALDLWKAYNRRLLAYVSERPDGVLWFNYDLPYDQAVANLKQLCLELNLSTNLPWDELFNPLLRHHEGGQEIPDDETAEIYQSLLELAEHSSSSALRNSSPSRETNAAAAERANSAAQPPRVWKQLVGIQHRHDELLQRHNKWFDQIRGYQSNLTDRVDKRAVELHERMNVVQGQLNVQQEQTLYSTRQNDSRLEKLQQDLLMMGRMIDSNPEVRGVLDRLGALEQRHTQFASQLCQDHASVENLDQSVASLRTEAQGARADLTQLRGELAQARIELVQARGELVEFTSHRQTVLHELAGLRQLNENVLRDVASLDGSVSLLLSEGNEHKQRWHEVSRRVAFLSGTLDAWRNQWPVRVFRMLRGWGRALRGARPPVASTPPQAQQPEPTRRAA